MVSQAALETTLANTLKPTLSDSGDLKGVARQRLRIHGKKVESKDDVEKAIVALLQRPMTTGQIAASLKRTPKTLRRDYLKPMCDKALIEQKGDYYVRKGTTERVVEREHFDDIVKQSAFAKLDCLKDYVAHARSVKKGNMWVAKLRHVCTGKTVPNFKVRPEHWTEETTLQFIAAYKDFKKIDRLPGDIRQFLRYVHEYLLHKPITETQKEQWGVDGTKDNAGIYNHIKLSAEQIKACTDFFLNKGDLETAAYVAAGIEMFGRPEAMFKAATGTMTLTPRTLEYAAVAGSKKENFDPLAVEQMRIIAALHPNLVQIKEMHDEIYQGTLREFKTNHAPWPKYILDQHAKDVFKEYTATRKGKPTYFGLDGENYFDFNQRMSKALRPAYVEIGMLQSVSHQPEKGTGEWYIWRKPSYSLRHFGAHLWLARLGGSYEALSEMAWEDPNIPKKFYAGYHDEGMKARIARRW